MVLMGGGSVLRIKTSGLRFLQAAASWREKNSELSLAVNACAGHVLVPLRLQSQGPAKRDELTVNLLGMRREKLSGHESSSATKVCIYQR